MSDKPTYLGLLNAISLGESEAECYLNGWAATTHRDDVRAVISTVAIREGEHGKAFAKRICELGYAVKPKSTSKARTGAEAKPDSKMEIACSTELSDREKFEKLQLGRAPKEGTTDVFASFFDDSTIDIQTGALLGRYIAEERDSGRMLRGCYEQLCREESGSVASVTATLEPLAAQLGRIEMLLEKLVAKK